MNQAYQNYLHKFITEHFDREELSLLCFELGVKYGNLGSSTLDGQARDLVTWMQRRKQLPLLAAQVSRARPAISFDPPLGDLAARWSFFRARPTGGHTLAVAVNHPPGAEPLLVSNPIDSLSDLL